MENFTANSDIENVRVTIRIRPFITDNLQERHVNILSVDKNNKILTLNKSLNNKLKSFTFDYIFSDYSTQIDLYQYVGYPIVKKTMEGYNGTIFAYGQSGTGKTYTMMGNQNNPELKGIIPNTFSHIFSQISKSNSEQSFVISVSYLEIYNESVRDLLSSNPSEKLEVREHKEFGVYVKNLKEFTVDSIESVNKLINRGNINRITRATMLNTSSSRSHAIFTINIECQNKINEKTTSSKLNLVDLAGSERLKRTQATGDGLKEAGSINQSLSVLGNVISALTDGTSIYIPYRNSKLTRLLQDSLGGNTKTLMIAMVSPLEIDYEETICTLRYASRVKYIKNNIQINLKNKQSMIEQFEREIEELRKRFEKISMKEIQFSEKKRKKNKINIEMMEQEEELKRINKEKNELVEKINAIRNKILIGGKSLLEVAEEQNFALENSHLELIKLEESHENLGKKLLLKGAERINIQEKYSSLQEEEIGLTDKIKKVQIMLQEVNEEHEDQEHEFQREIQSLMENNQTLNKELQLENLILQNYIPKKHYKKIGKCVKWDKEILEYQLEQIAYAGNNSYISSKEEKMMSITRGIKSSYFNYPDNKQKNKQRNKSCFTVRDSPIETTDKLYLF